MGKQAIFYANGPVLETINRFAAEHGLKFVSIEPTPDHDDWPVWAVDAMDVEELLDNRKHVGYYLIPHQTPLPEGKDAMVDFMADHFSHIEVALFMEATGYDSRVWFQTGCDLEQEGNKLLRRVRKIEKQQRQAKQTVAAN